MVQQAAETMINHLEDWLNCNISSKSFSLAHIFIDSLVSFYTTFDNWKAEDTRKIVDGMIAHWLELEKLWISGKLSFMRKILTSNLKNSSSHTSRC